MRASRYTLIVAGMKPARPSMRLISSSIPSAPVGRLMSAYPQVGTGPSDIGCRLMSGQLRKRSHCCAATKCREGPRRKSEVRRLSGPHLQDGGSPNILLTTSLPLTSKHLPWLSTMRTGRQAWIFVIAALAFRGCSKSGSRMPKKIFPRG